MRGRKNVFDGGYSEIVLGGNGERKSETIDNVLLKKWGPALILKKQGFCFRVGTISVCSNLLLICHNPVAVAIKSHIFLWIHLTKIPIPLTTYQLYVQRHRGTAQPEWPHTWQAR